jgi:cytochrome c-type biogenesis protein CcmE
MTATPIKITATVSVLALSLSGLMYTTLSEGAEYYKHVDEVMTDPSVWHGKSLQLHGYVVENSVFARKSTLEYRFEVQSNGKVVQARYTGVLPDTFKGGAEVVLKGRLGPPRIRRRPKRRHGEVPVEVRAARRRGWLMRVGGEVGYPQADG